MIKCNKGCSEIQGSTSNILSEYTVITKTIRKALTEYKSEEFAKSVLKRSFDLGMMSEDELDKEYEEAIKKFKGTGLVTMLSELFGGVHDAD